MKASAWMGLAAALAATATTASAGDAPGGFKGLPAGTNVLAAIDAAAVRKLGGDVGTRFLAAELAGDADAFTVAAELDLTTLQTRWEAASATFAEGPSARELAAAERGYVDRIADKAVVWSPRNAYLMPGEKGTMVAVTPANRQLVARLLRGGAGLVAEPSAYLADAWATAQADGHPPVLLALDLTDTLSDRALAAKAASLESLKGKDVAGVTEALKGLRGVTFTARFGANGPIGELRVDLAGSAAALADVGKPMLLEILAARGVTLPDLAGWDASAAGSRFALTGALTEAGLGQVMALFNAPIRLGSARSEATRPAAPSDAEAKAAASKRYFAAVTKVVSDVRNFKATTAGERASWNDRYARRIDALPMLNVDDELLDYGRDVSALLRGSALTIRGANMQANVDRSNNMVFNNVYDWNNDATANMRVSAEASRQGQQSYLGNLAEIERRTIDIRRRMTDRYKVEF